MAFNGKELKKIRKNKGMSQKELADLIGKTVSSIRKYESGDTQPPLKVIEKMSQVLDTPLKIYYEVDSFETPLEYEKEWILRGGGRHPGRIANLALIQINEDQLNDDGIQALADHSDLLVKSGQYKK